MPQRPKHTAPEPIRLRTRRVFNRAHRTKRFRWLIDDFARNEGQMVKWYVATVAGLLFLMIAGVAIFQFPELYVASMRRQLPGTLSPKEYLDSINAVRTTIIGVLTSLGVFVGAYLTLRNVAAAERNVKQAQEGQITDRFIKAIDKLGSDSLEMRLGGIYALERIAHDSERDHWPIMEILTAFVREHAALDATSTITDASVQGESSAPPPKLRADIQAVLTVLRRRNGQCEGKRQVIDLRGTDLSGAELEGAFLRGAIFTGSRLDRVNLSGADLEHANLSDCTLEGANLRKAFLQEANLERAVLIDANLDEALLVKANLLGCTLQNCSAIGVDMQAAQFVNTTITNVDLGRSDLRYTNFQGTMFDNVSVHRSNLEGVKLDGVDTQELLRIGKLTADESVVQAVEIDSVNAVPSANGTSNDLGHIVVIQSPETLQEVARK